MKRKLKWIAALVVGTCAAMWTGFAEGADYDALFAKARKYEEQGRYMYALGGYWDAMKADPKEAKDAYYAFAELANTIVDGNPGYGEFDEFSIYDGWLALCKDFEQYWTENCPNSFTFNIRKGELDMATRSATYYVYISVGNSAKFDAMSGYVVNGMKKKWKKSWTGIPKSWPLVSVYWDEEKTMMKNGVALFRPILRRTQYNSIPATMWYLNSGSTTLYDVKFNVTDENGKVLLSSGRKLMGSSGGYEFKNVPQDVMKILDAGKGRIVPTGVWLEYGQLTQNYYDDSRDWIKPLPEIAQDMSKMEFYLPGGIRSNDRQVVGNTEFYINDTGIVNLGKFYIMRTEVTWGQYSAIMGTSIPKSKSNIYPVNSVSWINAVKYCNLVSELQGFTPCYSLNNSTDIYDWGDDINGSDIECNFNANGWRLPKANEWIYAAQGGEKKNKYKFSGSNTVDEVGWNYYNSNYTTHEVATKKPNSLGLYDMTGNVAEWCWELLKKNADDELFDTTRRAVLGGSFYSSTGESEISYLDGHNQKSGSDTIGFRMVRNAEELPEEDMEVTNSKAEPETTPTSETAEAESSVSTEAESKSKAKEKKSKKDKKSKKEEAASAESDSNAQDGAEESDSAVAESDESDDSESSEDTEKKSNIFTKAKDKAIEAKDKVKDGTHNIMDKMKSKKKDKNK